MEKEICDKSTASKINIDILIPLKPISPDFNYIKEMYTKQIQIISPPVVTKYLDVIKN